MFDYSLIHWTTFLAAAVLLNLTPGPDMAFILAQTARGGRRAGFAAMFGVWAGAFGHVLMAAMGLTAVLAASAAAFTIVKWLGAAYLIWLGVQALLSRGGGFAAEAISAPQTSWPIFRQGVLVALLNPKVAIFFLAFLPQFVVPGAGPAWAQLFLHGALIIIVAGVIEPPLILAGARLIGRLRGSRKLGQWLDRGLGALFVTLGIKLALSER